jgi:hypothetical protein
MREIKSPEGVDSLGKLTEWLAECGMPQRDRGAEAAPEHAEEEMGLGFKFLPGDRETANQGYRNLLGFLCRAFYTKFSHADDQRLVWVSRPHLDEGDLTHRTMPDGSKIPPDWEGDLEELPEVKTEYRCGTIRCRFWLEPAA